MEKQSYLYKYQLDWELFDIVAQGRSPLDSKFFIGRLENLDQVHDFLRGYGVDTSNPISRAELFGIFQESLQFVRRYFLKEGNPQDGLPLTIPQSIYSITDVLDIFMLATGNMKNRNTLDRLWAEVIIKIMHTILHVDRDLRSSYFPIIQTQIFDRFYKYIYRDEDNKLYLGGRDFPDSVALADFETKSKKSRDSVIIKLLHKTENVAEELFDRVGVRFITHDILDAARVIKFVVRHNIVIPHNIKPSRSMNSLINSERFKLGQTKLTRRAIRENMSEQVYLEELAKLIPDFKMRPEDKVQGRNEHSSKFYQSIQFTGRQLIKYRNPFFQEFNEIKRFAKEQGDESELTKRLLALDTSHIAREVRFFYPFEVQITDSESYKQNTAGDASHAEYKRTKTKAAMKRVFWAMIQNLNIEVK